MSLIQAIVLTCLLAAYPCQAELTYTIAYIENLLKEGKSVAILLIDMQTGFAERFLGSETDNIIRDQITLIEALSQKDNLHFINVNYESQGKTLVELQTQLKKSAYLSQLTKQESNSFEGVITSTSSSDTQIPEDLTSFLNEKGVKDVVLVGCFDARCVILTAEAAAKEGFQTLVDRDLNIIFDTDDFRFYPKAAKEDFQMAYQRRWDELREEYPNLIVFDPVRYGICESEY